MCMDMCKETRVDVAILTPSQTEASGALENPYFLEIDKTMRNRVLCGRGFQAMLSMPSLDNVALIDFCSAKFDVG